MFKAVKFFGGVAALVSAAFAVATPASAGLVNSVQVKDTNPIRPWARDTNPIRPWARDTNPIRPW